jgi:hypothetical protein
MNNKQSPNRNRAAVVGLLVAAFTLGSNPSPAHAGAGVHAQGIRASSSGTSLASWGAADIDLKLTVTGVKATKLTGRVTFTGTTTNGASIVGQGTATLNGTKTSNTFRANGTGSIRFTGTLTPPNGSTSRVHGGSGALRFAPQSISGTNVIFTDIIITFLGGHTEGTGI